MEDPTCSGAVRVTRSVNRCTRSSSGRGSGRGWGSGRGSCCSRRGGCGAERGARSGKRAGGVGERGATRFGKSVSSVDGDDAGAVAFAFGSPGVTAGVSCASTGASAGASSPVRGVKVLRRPRPPRRPRLRAPVRAAGLSPVDSGPFEMGCSLSDILRRRLRVRRLNEKAIPSGATLPVGADASLLHHVRFSDGIRLERVGFQSRKGD